MLGIFLTLGCHSGDGFSQDHETNATKQIRPAFFKYYFCMQLARTTLDDQTHWSVHTLGDKTNISGPDTWNTLLMCLTKMAPILILNLPDATLSSLCLEMHPLWSQCTHTCMTPLQESRPPCYVKEIENSGNSLGLDDTGSGVITKQQRWAVRACKAFSACLINIWITHLC